MKKFTEIHEAAKAPEHSFVKGDKVTIPFTNAGKPDTMKGKVKRVTKSHVHVEPTGAGIPGSWKYHHSEVKKRDD